MLLHVCAQHLIDTGVTHIAHSIPHHIFHLKRIPALNDRLTQVHEALLMYHNPGNS